MDTLDTSFIVENLPSGRFELLIRGVDAQGIEGNQRSIFINVP
jgi:hypothetical protein